MEWLAFVVAVAGSIGLGLVVTHVMLTLLIRLMVRPTVAFDVVVASSDHVNPQSSGRHR